MLIENIEVRQGQSHDQGGNDPLPYGARCLLGLLRVHGGETRPGVKRPVGWFAMGEEKTQGEPGTGPTLSEADRDDIADRVAARLAPQGDPSKGTPPKGDDPGKGKGKAPEPEEGAGRTRREVEDAAYSGTLAALSDVDRGKAEEKLRTDVDDLKKAVVETAPRTLNRLGRFLWGGGENG